MLHPLNLSHVCIEYHFCIFWLDSRLSDCHVEHKKKNTNNYVEIIESQAAKLFWIAVQIRPSMLNFPPHKSSELSSPTHRVCSVSHLMLIQSLPVQCIRPGEK